jgi:hypothetical protein
MTLAETKGATAQRPAPQMIQNQEVPLSPCPECGGQRALFQYETDHGGTIYLHVGFGKNAQLFASTCLVCGATTLRPSPEKMEEIRAWATNQKPFKLS